MKLLLTLTTAFVCLMLVLAPMLVLAETVQVEQLKAGLNKSAGDAGINTSASNADLASRIGQVINYLFGIIGTIFLAIILVGGVSWMTAGGNEDKVGRGKKFIVGGVGGMLIIFSAYALVYFILQALSSGA